MVETERIISWGQIENNVSAEEISYVPLETVIVRQSRVSDIDPSVYGEDLIYESLKRSKQMHDGRYYQVVVTDGEPGLEPLSGEQLERACKGKVLRPTYSFSVNQQNGCSDLIELFEIIDKQNHPRNLYLNQRI